MFLSVYGFLLHTENPPSVLLFLSHSGTFIMEYCGEVCTPSDFEERKVQYVKDKRRHYYFMSLTNDEVRLLVYYLIY